MTKTKWAGAEDPTINNLFRIERNWTKKSKANTSEIFSIQNCCNFIYSLQTHLLIIIRLLYLDNSYPIILKFYAASKSQTFVLQWSIITV